MFAPRHFLALACLLSLSSPVAADEVFRSQLSAPIYFSGEKTPDLEPNVTETGRTSSQETSECPEGYSGNMVRTVTNITWSDGTTTQEVGTWDQSQCVALPTETSREPIYEYQSCGSGYAGSEVRTATRIHYSDGTHEDSVWSDWSREGCYVNSVVDTWVEYQESHSFCGNTNNYGVKIITATRTVNLYADGTATNPPYGTPDPNCYVTSSSSGVVLYQNEYRTCASGIGQERRRRQVTYYSNKYPLYGAWGSYTDITCH